MLLPIFVGPGGGSFQASRLWSADLFFYLFRGNHSSRDELVVLDEVGVGKCATAYVEDGAVRFHCLCGCKRKKQDCGASGKCCDASMPGARCIIRSGCFLITPASCSRCAAAAKDLLREACGLGGLLVETSAMPVRMSFRDVSVFFRFLARSVVVGDRS